MSQANINEWGLIKLNLLKINLHTQHPEKCAYLLPFTLRSELNHSENPKQDASDAVSWAEMKG